jgi:hypothetical protein
MELFRLINTLNKLAAFGIGLLLCFTYSFGRGCLYLVAFFVGRYIIVTAVGSWNAAHQDDAFERLQHTIGDVPGYMKRYIALATLLSIGLNIVLAALLLGESSHTQLRGVVQRSEWGEIGWRLSLGTQQSSDYILLDRDALLASEDRMVLAQYGPNLLLFGNQYVGKRVRVAGEVQRDSANRRFIRVTRLEQIELL